MTKDEALKLALDALEEINKLSIGENAICLPAGIDTAMDAIKQVLAQQEYQGSDAAKAAHMMDLYEALGVKWGDDPFSAIAKLREAQPEPVIDKSAAVRIATSLGWEPKRKPLTDEEIWKFWWSRPEVAEGEDDSMEAEFVSAVRGVLAAHGIKE